MTTKNIVDDLKPVYKQLSKSEKLKLLERLEYELTRLYYAVDEKKQIIEALKEA